MSNEYFQFKQFRLQQDRCAMKVSTDACIQGAWTPICDNANRVLDIGTGTGLLSLMTAQRHPFATIDAIELDEQAALQASDNIAHSPYADRINVSNIDIRIFSSYDKYDLIICNPPFFQNSLLGDTQERNIARHTLTLQYIDIIHAFERLLHPNAYASVLLPYNAQKQWEQLLVNEAWNVFHRLVVKHRAGNTPTRVISLCSKGPQGDCIEEDLTIKGVSEEYTTDFAQLLCPFYLHL
ncbi:MAG: methyltransferase [Bacteroidota bacterium]